MSTRRRHSLTENESPTLFDEPTPVREQPATTVRFTTAPQVKTNCLVCGTRCEISADAGARICHRCGSDVKTAKDRIDATIRTIEEQIEVLVKRFDAFVQGASKDDQERYLKVEKARLAYNGTDKEPILRQQEAVARSRADGLGSILYEELRLNEQLHPLDVEHQRLLASRDELAAALPADQRPARGEYYLLLPLENGSYKPLACWTATIAEMYESKGYRSVSKEEYIAAIEGLKRDRPTR